MRSRAKMPERFWENVIPEPNTGCWLWLGAMLPNGYGTVQVEGKTEYSHRVSYRLSVGEIPAGLDIDHLCRNRFCCNPGHLEAVTRSVNVKRGLLKDGPEPSPGEKHPMHKLKEAEVYLVRESVGSADAIGAKFGISGTQVSRIRNRISWKCLPERDAP